jgi:hypothetical protein
MNDRAMQQAPGSSVNFRVKGADTEDSNQSFDLNDLGESEEEKLARELKKAKVRIY